MIKAVVANKPSQIAPSWPKWRSAMASYTCIAKKCRPVYFAFGGKSSVKPMWELIFEFIHKNTFYQRGTADSSTIPSTLGNFIFLFPLVSTTTWTPAARGGTYQWQWLRHWETTWGTAMPPSIMKLILFFSCFQNRQLVTVLCNIKNYTVSLLCSYWIMQD